MNTHKQAATPNVAYTIEGKQYLAVLSGTNMCNNIRDKNKACVFWGKCNSQTHSKECCGSEPMWFVRVRETMKGRRCIKSDFKIGRKLFRVSKHLLDMWSNPLSKGDVECWQADMFTNIIAFTTARAAQAYIDSRKGR